MPRLRRSSLRTETSVSEPDFQFEPITLVQFGVGVGIGIGFSAMLSYFQYPPQAPPVSGSVSQSFFARHLFSIPIPTPTPTPILREVSGEPVPRLRRSSLEPETLH